MIDMLKRVVAAVRGDETRDMTRIEAPGEWYDGFPVTGASRSGVNVTETTALGSIPIFAAVMRLAETMGSIPLPVYRRTQPWGKERAREHPLYSVLTQSANDEMTAQTWIETTMIHACAWGAGYSYIDRDSAENVIDFTPLLPDRTQPVRLTSGATMYETTVDGVKRYLRPDQVMHIKGPSLNGYTGLRRLQMAKDSIGAGIASDRYASQAFANGVHPSGTVSHPQGIGPKAARQLRQDISNQHTGLDNQHKVIVLQEGATFSPFDLDLTKSQLLDVRRYSVEEAGRLFGVPSIMLNHTKDSNYSIGEQLMRYFIMHTLRPWGVRFKQEIGRKALKESEKAEFFVEFLFDDLLTGDYAAKGTYYRELFNLGAITTAEIRERENLNPFSEDPTLGTRPVVNAAYLPLADIGKPQTPNDEQREAQPSPVVTDEADDKAPEPFNDGDLLSVGDIHSKYQDIARGTVQQRLDRWRKTATSGFTTDPNAKPPLPRTRYRWASVKGLFASDTPTIKEKVS